MSTKIQQLKLHPNENEEDIITYDMIKEMPGDFWMPFKYFFPKGLALGKLAEASEKHNVFRIVYKYVIKEYYNGKSCLD